MTRFPQKGGEVVMRMIGGNQFPTLTKTKMLIEEWWQGYNHIMPDCLAVFLLLS
jgi:hypothetical protein